MQFGKLSKNILVLQSKFSLFETIFFFLNAWKHIEKQKKGHLKTMAFNVNNMYNSINTGHANYIIYLA